MTKEENNNRPRPHYKQASVPRKFERAMTCKNKNKWKEPVLATRIETLLPRYYL